MEIKIDEFYKRLATVVRISMNEDYADSLIGYGWQIPENDFFNDFKGYVTVGDWNDLKSMVRKSADDDRAYQALEEVGVKPNVWFKVKVRNEENKDLDKHQKIELKKEGHGEKKNSQH